MSNIEEIRSMAADELKSRAQDLRREVFDLKLKLATDASVLARYRAARKELARVLTITRENAAAAAKGA